MNIYHRREEAPQMLAPGGFIPTPMILKPNFMTLQCRSCRSVSWKDIDWLALISFIRRWTKRSTSELTSSLSGIGVAGMFRERCHAATIVRCWYIRTTRRRERALQPRALVQTLSHSYGKDSLVYFPLFRLLTHL